MHPAIKKIYLHALKEGHSISFVPIENSIHIDKGHGEANWGAGKTSVKILDNESYVLTGYYDNGTVRYVRSYRGNALHGKSIGYHKDGEVKYEGSYIGNQKHGEWKHYNVVGNVESIEIFENGKKVSKVERY